MRINTLLTSLVTLSLAFALAGCGTPKPPPGWPSGQARPINPTLPNAGAAEATTGKTQ